ncbi:hypothetical protein Acr_08g0014820 [Actinidia rufa]|uniref:Uncharacterized protein n=1 Tax=Actinidia rufa TaxID=165716 RepID=A0A7J0F3U5_9ERIC|nr:hypothetical protein Acr_08g0014820 [Actinidia rufa]
MRFTPLSLNALSAISPRRRPPPSAPKPSSPTPNPPPPPLSHSSSSPASTTSTESTTTGTESTPLFFLYRVTRSVHQNPFWVDGFAVEPWVVPVLSS